MPVPRQTSGVTRPIPSIPLDDDGDTEEIEIQENYIAVNENNDTEENYINEIDPAIFDGLF